MENTELAVISRSSWMSLYEQHEFIRQFWTRNIEENYIGMEERVFNLIAKTAEERYCWMHGAQPRFIQEVPDKYLASMLGIHPRHLTRLRAMRK
jgi:CRP/FNR family transcriptional regulator, anaerobic regulatory protein